MKAMGDEFARLFADAKVDKVPVESSIAPAVFTAYIERTNGVCAQEEVLTLSEDHYTVLYSFTKQETNHVIVDKRFIQPGERLLLIDDFLANGQAVEGMMQIAEAADAEVVGVGIVIEKTFQKGRALLDERDVRVESLARIAAFEDGEVIIAD